MNLLRGLSVLTLLSSVLLISCSPALPESCSLQSFGVQCDTEGADDSSVLLQTAMRVQALPPEAVPQASVCAVLAPLWQAARLDIGVDDLAQDINCDHLAHFYSFGLHDREEFALLKLAAQSIRPTSLEYVMEYKCANTEIACNLQRSLHRSSEPGNVAHFSQESCDSDNNCMMPLSFTFVREPIAHLLSGYNEIEYFLQRGEPQVFFDFYPLAVKGDVIRESIESCGRSNCTFLAHDVNSLSRAKAFLHDIVTLRLPPSFLFKHVYSMLGPVVDFNIETGRRIDMIGHLESFDDDWEHLQELMNVKLPRFKTDCKAHNYSNSGSGFSAKKYLQDEIEQGTSSSIHSLLQIGNSHGHQFSRALHCAVLLPEYVCFDYENPVTPEECVSAGYATSLQAWSGIISHLTNALCPGGLSKTLTSQSSKQ